MKNFLTHFLLVFITTCTVFFAKAQCPATAPTVKNSVSNNCPSNTVNLNTQAHTGAIPVSSTLIWFTNSSHTGTAYATPTSATAGTYYAFYYNSTSNCYSPASTAVTVTTTVCQPCTAADPVSVNLNTQFDTGTVPSGSVAEWHTSATPSASTLISSGIVMATSTPTNYWIFYRNTASNCYSPGSKVVVVSNLCCNYANVDLTSLPQTTPPAGSVVEWYMANNHIGKVSNPTSAVEGVYFPFFYDPVNNCYSPAGTPVLVALDYDCCTNTPPPVNTFVSAVCPAGTANLNIQAHTGAVPAGYTLLWFRDVAGTSPVTDPTAVGAGSYYAYYYNPTLDCYSPVSTQVNVVVFVCSPCTASDAQSVNLATRFPVAIPPSGSTTEWHNSASPSASTLLSSTTVLSTSTPTNYWVYYHNGSGYTLVSQVVAVTNSCCNYPTVDLNSVNTSTAPSGSTKVWFTTSTHDSGTEVAAPTFANEDRPYWPFFYNSTTDTYTSAGAPVLVTIDRVCTSGCYRPGVETGGTVLDTKVGISSLGRAGSVGDNWPMVRKGGHIALESKTKAFVPNRVAFSDADNNVSTPDVPVGISAANFVEGMMLYDTTNKCLKIYTLKEGDSTMAWHCFTTPACPD